MKRSQVKAMKAKVPKNSMSKQEFIKYVKKNEWSNYLKRAKKNNDEKDVINRKATQYEIKNKLPRGSLGSFSNKYDKKLQVIANRGN